MNKPKRCTGVPLLCVLLGCGSSATDSGPSPKPEVDTKQRAKLPFQKDVKVIDTSGGEEITAGDLRLRVDDVRIGAVKVQPGSGQPFAARDEDYLLIQLTLTNVGSQRKLRYTGWGSFDAKAGGNAARLTDEQDRLYKPIDFGQDATVEGQLRSVNLIEGKPRQDLLMFQVPPSDVKALRLELPRANFGDFGLEPIRLRLTLKR